MSLISVAYDRTCILSIPARTWSICLFLIVLGGSSLVSSEPLPAVASATGNLSPADSGLAKPLAGIFDLSGACPGGVGIVSLLIQDINSANSNGHQTNTIKLAEGCTYNMSAVDNNTNGPNGLPSITSQLTIEGNGTTIQRTGSTNFRIFHVAADGDLTLENLTVRNGRAVGADGDSSPDEGQPGSPGQGGGIYNSGTLALVGSTITDNAAIGGNGSDGERGNPGTPGSRGKDGRDASCGLFTCTDATDGLPGSNGGRGGDGFNGGKGGDGQGGGIYNAGNLTLINSTVTDNSAIGGQGGHGGHGRTGGDGGGGGKGGDAAANVFDCGSAGDGGDGGDGGPGGDGGDGGDGGQAAGGGIYNANEAILNHSTISHNSVSTSTGGAGGSGNDPLKFGTGGFRGFGGDGVDGLVCTRPDGIDGIIGSPGSPGTDGSSGSAIPGIGGGVYGLSGNTSFNNTILAQNDLDCGGDLSSQDYNLIQNTTDCQIAGSISHNITGQDPLLGPLQNNGGPTETRALQQLPGEISPAIDAGDPDQCPVTDQRGETRPKDGDGDSNSICDIGAYEAPNFGDEDPTAITLVSFTATSGPDGVTLAWETGTEIDNVGFNLYRALAEDGPYIKINEVLIPATGEAVSGASYAYFDGGLSDDTIYYYKLEDVDFFGVSTLHGPVSIASGIAGRPGADGQMYLPLIVKNQ